MIENIAGVRIEGGIFEPAKTLNIFKHRNDTYMNRAVVLYGRNGSGKSTVSNACLVAKGDSRGISYIKKASFIDESGAYVNLSEEDKRNI